jgi:hypothetical protein
MANGKLANIPAKNAPGLQPEVGATRSPAATAFQAREGIQLMRAFARIADVAQRARLIAQAESMAGSRSGSAA